MIPAVRVHPGFFLNLYLFMTNFFLISYHRSLEDHYCFNEVTACLNKYFIIVVVIVIVT